MSDEKLNHLSSHTEQSVISDTAPDSIRCTRIDFPLQTGLTEYKDHYAIVVDDAFSPEECAALLELAESTAPPSTAFSPAVPEISAADAEPTTGGDPWRPAAIYTVSSSEEQVVRPNYRDSGRIIVDSYEVAYAMYRRLRPFVEDEVGFLGPFYGVGLMANKTAAKKGPWKMSGLNERLRFLKYEVGQFFKPHRDAVYTTPDRSATSFITVQIYLSPADVKGGTTRFHSFDKKRYYDVEPRLGRALIFQQAGLKHSGEAIEEGIKYTVRTEFMYERTKWQSNGGFLALFLDREARWSNVWKTLKFTLIALMIWYFGMYVFLGGSPL